MKHAGRLLKFDFKFKGLSFFRGSSIPSLFFVVLLEIGLSFVLAGCKIGDNSIKGTSGNSSGSAGATLKADIQGAPVGTVNTTILNLTISSDVSKIASYQYKIGVGSSFDCTDVTGYSEETPASEAIGADVSSLADGDISICVISKDDKGNTQTALNATKVIWKKDTQIPVVALSPVLSSPSASSVSNDVTPQISDSSISGEVGSSVNIYSDSLCTNLLGTSLIVVDDFTVSNITLASDGSADGAINFYSTYVDVAGNQSICTDTTVGYTLDTQGPTAPTTLTAGANSNNLTTSPTFSWVAGTDVTSSVVSHEVQIHLASDDSVVQAWQVRTSGQSVTGLSLTDGVSYYWKVRSVDSAGNAGAEAQGSNFFGQNSWVVSPSWMIIKSNNAFLSGSTDGRTWVDMPIPDGLLAANDIEYGEGLWVLVGESLTNTPMIFTSTDGVAWSQQDITAVGITDTAIRKIAYANQSGRFMAFTSNEVIYSDDAISWTKVAGLTISNSVNGSYAQGKWVLGQNTATATSSVVFSTDNGVNWSTTNDNTTANSDYGLFVNGKWLVMGVGSPSSLATSALHNGAYTEIIAGVTHVPGGETVYGNGVLLTPGDNATIGRSIDNGATWTGIALGSDTCATEFGNGQWIAITNGASLLSSKYSTDKGATWTAMTSEVVTAGAGDCEAVYGGSQNDPDGLVFAEKFDASGGSNLIVSDTIVLTNFTGSLKVYAGNGAEVSVNGAGYVAGDGTASVSSGDNLKIRMTSGASVGDSVYSSVQVGTDLIHWKVTTVSPISWVLAGPDGKLSVSSDYINWTDVDLSAIYGTADISEVAWGNDKWIAVGQSGKMVHSTDGLNWTQVDVSATFSTNTFYGLHYNGIKWIASAGAVIASSADGTTWTTATSSSGTPHEIISGRGTDWAYVTSGSDIYISTDDGDTWTNAINCTASSSTRQGLMYGNGIYFAGETSQSSGVEGVKSLNDGGSWSCTQEVVDYYGAYTAKAVYGNDFFAVGSQDYGMNHSSNATASWSGGFYSGGMNAVAFGDGTFVIGVHSGRITTSTNLSSFTTRVTKAVNWQDAAYGGSSVDPSGLTLADKSDGAGGGNLIESDAAVVSNFVGTLKVYAGNGAEVSVNGGGYVSGNGTATVSAGDSVRIRITSVVGSGNKIISTVQIGARIVHWQVSTL